MENDFSMPVFIFASGQRTGSTLLQRYLNTHSQILLWGEHNGQLKGIFESFENIENWQIKFSHHLNLFLEDGYNNFIANMTPHKEDIAQAKRSLLFSLWGAPSIKLGRSIWGFKEVRYDASMAKQIHELFTNCKIIHLTRNIKDCYISLLHWERYSREWTRMDTLGFIQNWIQVNQSFSDLFDEQTNYSWIFPLTYEELVQNPIKKTKQISDWFNIQHDEFDMEVFKYKIYTEKYKGADVREPIEFSKLPISDRQVLFTEEIYQILRRFNLEDSWFEK